MLRPRHLEHAWQNAAAACASVMSTAGALATRDLSVTYFGVQLPVVLAALAGAGLILSFLPRRPADDMGDVERVLRLFGTVILCALCGAYVAAWLPRFWLAAAGAELFIAFAVGAGGQIFVPLAIERRREVWDLVLGWFSRRGGTGGGS